MTPDSVTRMLKIYDEWHEAFVLEHLYGEDLGRASRVTEQWQHKRKLLFDYLVASPSPKDKQE